MLPILLSLLLIYLIYRRFRPPPSTLPPPPPPPSALSRLRSEALSFSPPLPSSPRILILYATEYGFSKEVAQTLASHLHSLSFHPRILSTLHYNLFTPSLEPYIALISSTTGDGAPPTEASEFHEALSTSTLQLTDTSFSVLALGDRSYPHYCRAGRQFDQLLGKTGNRLVPRVDIDQEDWPKIQNWIDSLGKALIEKLDQQEAHEQTDDYLPEAIDKYAKMMASMGMKKRYSRSHPFGARLMGRRILTNMGTAFKDEKETIRVEFDLKGSELEYTVGDALGVMGRNNEKEVDDILRSMASDGDDQVWVDDEGVDGLVRFQEVLERIVDLKNVKMELIRTLGRRSDDDMERTLAEKILGSKWDEEGNLEATVWGKQYLKERVVVEVLEDFVSATITPQELIENCRRLHARYYSISTSRKQWNDVVGITVDVLRYEVRDRQREGVVSTFLKERCKIDGQVGVFISKNENFRLPKDHDRPIIMIGPGTGIAPFVGFIEERVYDDAKGKNWLFFGCRHEQQDFLYKEELKRWERMEQVVLFTAFSRDCQEKVYVQQLMLKQGDKLWKLINDEHAHVYVCGDGNQMAKDVDDTLRSVIEEHGKLSSQQTDEYVLQLAQSKRYQRDVWVS